MFHDPYGYGYAQPPGFRQTYSPRQEQARQSGPDWMFVPCIRDAANVTVPPGGKAWIMAQDQPQFAVKAADSLGMTTTDYYRFERFDPSAEDAARTAQFVTRDELESILSQRLSAALSQRKEPEHEPAV